MNDLDFGKILQIVIIAYIVAIIAVPILDGIILYFRHKVNILRTLKRLAKRVIIIAITSGVLLGLGVVAVYASRTPQIIASYPAQDGQMIDYNKPIEVTFNLPVEVKNLNPTITPQIQGKWVWDPYDGFIKTLTRHGRFYPDETLFPNQRVVVYIVGVNRVGYVENHELGFNFNAPGEAELVSTYPEDKSTTVKRDDNLKLTLSKDNNYLSEWNVALDPAVDMDPITQTGSAFDINLKDNLLQQKTYKMTISRRPVRYSISQNKIIEYGDADFTKEITFTTVKEPLIQNFAPQGSNIKVDQTIKVQFSLPMKRDSVEAHFKSDPALTGQFKWSDDKNFEFIPTNKLSKETKYKVTFGAGTESLDQGVFSKDINYQFQTIGAVKVASFQPGNNQQRVMENANILVAFDQEVDKASAQSHFAMSPGVGGSFSWSGNNMIFNPSGNLNFAWTYTIKVSAGVKAIYGVDSKQEFDSKFTVRPAEIIIGGVPEYYQPQPSDSCNIYAAKMVLAWAGYNLGASSIIAELGYNANQSGGQWTGDPYTQYVGNATGSWGYGVYWSAIQRLFSNRGIGSQVHTGWTTSGIASSIASGHPVIIWRWNATSSYYSYYWTASDGRSVYAINGQHGGVVIGFRGSIDNPTQFLLNDPWFGQFWISASTFDSYWAKMLRAALVVD